MLKLKPEESPSPKQYFRAQVWTANTVRHFFILEVLDATENGNQ